MRKQFVIGIIALIGLVLAGCGDDNSNPQQTETQTQQENYQALTDDQPAVGGTYSPTRDTINFWTQTWMQSPDKLSYVYLMGSNGQLIGYFIFEGLPVSMCASLTPTYRWEDIPGDGGDTDTMVPAPSVDGVFYSGGQCNVYYGRDAESGSYVEFSIGNGINYLLFDQPIPRQDVEPLGVATVDSVR